MNFTSFRYNKNIPILLLLAVFGGICLQAGFWGKGWVMLGFMGWVCLWQAEKILKETFLKRNFLRRLLVAFLFLFVWNVVATWWVRITGALWVISVANSLVMLVPLVFWWWVRKFFAEKYEKWLFIPIWISFEFAHHHWQLTWVWLTLGNTFLYQNEWVQWYEYTGVWGGSLWILLVNVVFWEIKEAFSIKKIAFLVALLAFPITFSWILREQKLLPTQKLNVVLVQPNIDPFTEKFNDCPRFIPFAKQAQILVDLTLQKFDKNADLVVFPETALDENFDERWVRKYPTFQKIDSLQQKLNVPVLLGVSTRIFTKEKSSPTSQYAPLSNAYYEDFNTALLLQKDTMFWYKKMILVPGVETIPFPEYTIFLKDFISDIGASFFLLGVGKEISTFPTSKAQIAPIICYESMYGEFLSKFVQKGADLLCTITNDGWLGDTEWQKHHLYLGALRCIETRREMLHCSNMGASAVIDVWGKVRSEIPYNQRTSMKAIAFTYQEKTFYTHYGDFLPKIALSFVGVIFLASLVRFFQKKLK
ncbi:lnt: apolipoprotein N-acyltransferase [Raineya orbicola]|jgi:apolipoprotein N-acyltransferase|uniref:Apolipoprotein N-acyltransferase n=2 Tax=Raineya orbicola TaxID=2016530 RepID=A0A2N3IJ91_9BACT|nr:lnt: apolipoprotein N-acyltransferase [Raineya orbicola]